MGLLALLLPGTWMSFLEVHWPPHWPEDEGLEARDAEWEDGKFLLDLDISTLEGLSLVVFSIICCRKQSMYPECFTSKFCSLPFLFPSISLPSFFPSSHFLALCLSLSCFFIFLTSDSGKLRSIQNLAFASVKEVFSGCWAKCGGVAGETYHGKETTLILLFVLFVILGIRTLTYPNIFI